MDVLNRSEQATLRAALTKYAQGLMEDVERNGLFNREEAMWYKEQITNCNRLYKDLTGMDVWDDVIAEIENTYGV